MICPCLALGRRELLAGMAAALAAGPAGCAPAASTDRREAAVHGGLSAFGRDVVREMNPRRSGGPSRATMRGSWPSMAG